MRIGENGLIINEGSEDKFQEEFKPLINKTKKELLNNLDDIHSIYVRGSVSEGKAYLFTSDIDIVLVTQKNLNSKEKPWLKSLVGNLEKEFPIVTDADITCVTIEDLINKSKNLKFNLKTQSCLIHGEDIRGKIENFYVGNELAKFLYGDFLNEIVELRKKFQGSQDSYEYLGNPKPISFWCRWTMRLLVRSTMAITMSHNKTYSSDLTECYKSFVTAHPKLENELGQAMKWQFNPIDDKKEIIRYLDSFIPKYGTLLRKEQIIQ